MTTTPPDTLYLNDNAQAAGFQDTYDQAKALDPAGDIVELHRVSIAERILWPLEEVGAIPRFVRIFADSDGFDHGEDTLQTDLERLLVEEYTPASWAEERPIATAAHEDLMRRLGEACEQWAQEHGLVSRQYVEGGYVDMGDD